MNNILHL